MGLVVELLFDHAPIPAGVARDIRGVTNSWFKNNRAGSPLGLAVRGSGDSFPFCLQELNS